MSISMFRRTLLATSCLSLPIISAVPSAFAQQALDPIEVEAPQPRARSVTSAPPAAVTSPTRIRVSEPVVVTSPTTVPTPETEVASSVTVVTREEIERDQRRTVNDILSTVPGLNIIQTGGPGGLTSVFTRGTNSNHTKILIDGINVGDPANSNGAFDYSTLLAGDIERIEILRGPQSGLYGADALGGVISITTKRGSGPPKVSATIEGGSFGTFNQTAGVSGSYNKFDYAFNVSHFRSTDTPVTPLDLLPPGRRRNNDFYDNVTLSTKLGADVNENLRFNFVARYTDAISRYTTDEFDLMTFTSVPRAFQDRRHVEQFHTRSEAVFTALDGRVQSFLGLNYSNNRATDISPDPANSTASQGERLKFDWRTQYMVLPGQIIVAGAEHERESFTKGTISPENSNTAGFLELQSNPFERAFVVANVRYDDNERFGGHATWRVAPSYVLPGTETKLKASVGTGFKAPTLSQLFEDFPAFGFFANPNLKPEESTGYDVGFEQPLAGGRVRFGATYFHNDITNLIAANPTFTTNINIGKASTEGVESFVAVSVTERIRLRADYTYTKAFNEITGLELLRRPRNKASVTVGWTPIDPLVLSATVLYVGEFVDGNRDFSIPRLTNPGYTLVNVVANYQVNPYTKVFARVDNLFNEKYENPTGFLGRGIGVFGGIRVTN